MVNSSEYATQLPNGRTATQTQQRNFDIFLKKNSNKGLKTYKNRGAHGTLYHHLFHITNYTTDSSLIPHRLPPPNPINGRPSCNPNPSHLRYPPPTHPLLSLGARLIQLVLSANTLFRLVGNTVELHAAGTPTLKSSHVLLINSIGLSQLPLATARILLEA